MTWRRSDLTPAGLGRALVMRSPHLCLSRFGESWVLTDPLGRSTVGTLARVLDVIRDRGGAGAGGWGPGLGVGVTPVPLRPHLAQRMSRISDARRAADAAYADLSAHQEPCPRCNCDDPEPCAAYDRLLAAWRAAREVAHV